MIHPSGEALLEAEVDVLRVRDRLVVVGADGSGAHCHGEEPA